jgi:uncharacterized protein DUF3142
MNPKRKLAALMLALVSFSCSKTSIQNRNRIDENNFPQTVLWAWERPEELEFLDPRQFAVAFLAQTLVLKGDEVVFQPRHQPLKVRPEVKLMAVTRIESRKVTGAPSALSPAQRERLVELILKSRELKNVSAIQIDFDAASSEREFYRRLLQDLRERLPDNVPLSITALASFCVGDRWLEDLPIDEAVPMIFRMGADDQTIKSFLGSGKDFHAPICRRSYGIAVDEPVKMSFDRSRRRYVFNVRAWAEQDVLSLQQGTR